RPSILPSRPRDSSPWRPSGMTEAARVGQGPWEEPSKQPAGDALQLTVAPLEARGLHKSYRSGDGSELHVLDGVNLRLEPGEAVAVIGASGAGKSTLLHLLGALDRPTAGEVL